MQTGERASERNAPGIKRRQRHCWEELPQTPKENVCPREAAVRAGGKEGGQAENSDFDGAREQANGAQPRS